MDIKIFLLLSVRGPCLDVRMILTSKDGPRTERVTYTGWTSGVTGDNRIRRE